MIFDQKDQDIIDSDVLRRVLHFANQSQGDLSHAAEDIELLKRKSKETEKQLSNIKKDVAQIAREEAKHASKEDIKEELTNLNTQVKWIKIIAGFGLVLFMLQFIASVIFYAYIIRPELFDWIKL